MLFSLAAAMHLLCRCLEQLLLLPAFSTLRVQGAGKGILFDFTLCFFVLLALLPDILNLSSACLLLLRLALS